MTTFNIVNQVSGVDLGNYEGADEEAAMDAFALDAGYTCYADAIAQGWAAGELLVTLVA